MNPHQQQVSEILKRRGFAHFGFTSLTRPLSVGFYQEWLAAGFHGDMEYLKRHAEKKAEPQKLLPKAVSAIVVTEDYLPHPRGPLPVKNLRVALYARGEDYHDWLKTKLEAVVAELKSAFPGEEFVAFTDSAPVLERDLAARSGVGWLGKNGCVIHPKRGSLFFLGEIYTTLDLKAVEALHPDRCGRCTRCIDICPTRAIVEPKKVDARRCISYLTIESRAPAPESLRPGIGDWFFGCDLCQTVCPWNEKVFGAAVMKKEREPEVTRESLIADLRWILQASDEVLRSTFKGTALLRRGPVGLKRNALVVIGNTRLREMRDDVRDFLAHAELGGLAHWTLGQIGA